MIKLPYHYITETTTWRDHNLWGYLVGPTRTTVRCQYCVSDYLAQQMIPQAGEEIEIEGAIYCVINMNMENQSTYWKVTVDCIPVEMKPAVPDFVYDSEQLMEGLREIFRKMRYT